MVKEEDVRQVKMNLSVEFFETFDPDKQLHIINRAKDVLAHLAAVEDDFPPKHIEELIEHLEHRIDELQIIYNMRTNRRLDEFLK